MANPRLSCQQLGFYYHRDQWLFRDLSFELQAGDILAILGKNGTGKSTLLDVLMAIQPAQQGKVICQQRFSFVPQFFTPSFAYSVLDIVLMGRAQQIGLFSQPTEKDKSYALQILDSLNLLALAQQDFRTLSGGQKQMVLIARALASEAKIMLLDEPTSALDLHNQNNVLNLLYKLSVEQQFTIIFTTHHPDHACLLANKTLLLNQENTLFGETKQIMTEHHLSQLFGINMKAYQLMHKQYCFQHFSPLYDLIQYEKNTHHL